MSGTPVPSIQELLRYLHILVKNKWISVNCNDQLSNVQHDTKQMKEL